MIKTAHRNPWTNPSLIGLVTATVVVLGATAYWALSMHSDSRYLAPVTGAWTTTIIFWVVFIARRLLGRKG